VLVFDEPLHGLDPHGMRVFKDSVLQLRDNGAAVLISIHVIESVANDWDTCFILDNGSLVKKVVRREMGTDTLQNVYSSVVSKSPKNLKPTISERLS
jgi:ABC-type multidrug transport system ATPase subunit